jgi:hypothetical protein
MDNVHVKGMDTMGAMQRKKEEVASKKRRVVRGGGVADWVSADGDKLKQTIAAVARTGGALRFGYSRDGGAYAVGVLGDGDPYTLWHPGNEDVNDLLDDIHAGFAD